MSNKRRGDSEHRKQPLSRRELIGKAALAAGAVTAGGYLALAPEDWPLALRDEHGLRGLPRPEPFRLRDYRVAKPAGRPDVAVGRGPLPVENLRKALDALGGLTHYVQPGDVVLVKPNVAFDRSPNMGATSDPVLLDMLVRMLLVDCRAGEVRVADNPIESPADCFAKSGVGRAAEEAGGRVMLPDSNAFRMLNTPGATLIENWWFFRRPLEGVTKVIGLAPVKDHNLCSASMGVKNWYGLLGGRRNQFHQAIHEIVSDLSIMIRPTLTILDGSKVLMENGPTGGDPSNVRSADAVLAAVDGVAQDAWAYKHLLERADNLPAYLERAEAKGGGRVDFRGRIREVT